MKLLIAGSRHLRADAIVEALLADLPWVVTAVVSGKEPTGVDAAGERWAEARGIPVIPFPAEWNKYEARGGRSNPAGLIRNRDMAEACDAALIIWDGVSPGTAGMIRDMKAFPHKPVILHTIGQPTLRFE